MLVTNGIQVAIFVFLPGAFTIAGMARSHSHICRSCHIVLRPHIDLGMHFLISAHIHIVMHGDNPNFQAAQALWRRHLGHWMAMRSWRRICLAGFLTPSST